MIETGSEYQLLQHFEAMPSSTEVGAEAKEVAITIDNSSSVPGEHHNNVPTSNKIVDGSKFESFFEAIVNIIVVIPVK